MNTNNAIAAISAIISGLTAIVGQAITASGIFDGWTRRVAKMIELYERLPSDNYTTALEEFAKVLLRREIFTSVYKRFGYKIEDEIPVPYERKMPTSRETLMQITCSLFASLIVIGIPESPREWLYLLLGQAAGWLIVRMGGDVLRHWPAISRNPFYQAEQHRVEQLKKDKEMTRKTLELVDRALIMRQPRRGTSKNE